MVDPWIIGNPSYPYAPTLSAMAFQAPDFVPEVDYILITHPHFDHMSFESIQLIETLYPNHVIYVSTFEII
jgi:L-ascorbate metabolism protein UlaG (beta-lactamase superfamily)